MGELKKWRDQKWVRIGTDGSIKGACGTSKNKKNPDRCLPLAKARSMSKAERAATAKKKPRVSKVAGRVFCDASHWDSDCAACQWLEERGQGGGSRARECVSM